MRPTYVRCISYIARKTLLLDLHVRRRSRTVVTTLSIRDHASAIPEAHPGAGRAKRPVELSLAAEENPRVCGGPLDEILQRKDGTKERRNEGRKGKYPQQRKHSKHTCAMIMSDVNACKSSTLCVLFCTW